MKKQNIQELLETASKGTDIRASVAQDALDYGDVDEAISYLKDVTEHGCASGTCSGLVYYADTYEFYSQHQDECDEVLYEYEENTGEGFKFEGRDVPNTLVWMAYEQRACELLAEIENN